MLKQMLNAGVALTAASSLGSMTAAQTPAAAHLTTGLASGLMEERIEDVYGGSGCFGVGSQACCVEMAVLAGVGCMTGNLPACAVATAYLAAYCTSAS